MSLDRYCVHCKHIINQTNPPLCSKHKSLDLVRGEEYALPCSLCRDLEKYCGTRAIYFDPAIEEDFADKVAELQRIRYSKPF